VYAGTGVDPDLALLILTLSVVTSTSDVAAHPGARHGGVAALDVRRDPPCLGARVTARGRSGVEAVKGGISRPFAL
jgi:hypothetical protein